MKRKPNAKLREQRRRAELRELRARAREIQRETLYVRTYVRRPLWSRTITVVWLIIFGILIGGGVIPHVDDKPFLINEGAAAVAEPPVSDPKPTTKEGPWNRMSYSWAPVEGATGYDVAFYRDNKLGPSRVAETTEPNYSIALPPGKYQWVVWPIIGGKSTSKAIVNSSVTVP